MSCDVDGQCEVWELRTRKARKPHTCDACKERIEPGHRYVSHFSIFEGDATTVKRCLRCDAIYQHLLERMDYDETPDQRLNCGHDYEERWGTEPPPEIAALAFLTATEAQERIAKGRADG